ncbi:hypothetical protein GOBAR_AA09373 [Gossypium barbadense]|uniref:Uncharacterized protein n=1 Tax=Gossypium barbadense TaxID=3634 RepID=A0A2P5Y6T3_GOSBA|nr:hypothetical protein GOBAR_AA09373 [Gossypium barbadense]
MGYARLTIPSSPAILTTLHAHYELTDLLKSNMEFFIYSLMPPASRSDAGTPFTVYRRTVTRLSFVLKIAAAQGRLGVS